MVEREEIVALLGSNLRLEIDTAEASRPEVQWSLPNKKVELTGGNSLELINLDYQDSGKYTATFERDDGTVGQKHFIVDVEGMSALVPINLTSSYVPNFGEFHSWPLIQVPLRPSADCQCATRGRKSRSPGMDVRLMVAPPLSTTPCTLMIMN